MMKQAQTLQKKLKDTQAELAKLSHIDQGDISKIERGLGNPTVAKISKLFEALGFSLGLSIFEKNS